MRFRVGIARIGLRLFVTQRGMMLQALPYQLLTSKATPGAVLTNCALRLPIYRKDKTAVSVEVSRRHGLR